MDAKSLVICNLHYGIYYRWINRKTKQSCAELTMAMMKVISLVDREIARARMQSVHDLELVQTQIVLKINEIMGICAGLRHDVDELMEKPEVLN